MSPLTNIPTVVYILMAIVAVIGLFLLMRNFSKIGDQVASMPGKTIGGILDATTSVPNKVLTDVLKTTNPKNQWENLRR